MAYQCAACAAQAVPYCRHPGAGTYDHEAFMALWRYGAVEGINPADPEHEGGPTYWRLATRKRIPRLRADGHEMLRASSEAWIAGHSDVTRAR